MNTIKFIPKNQNQVEFARELNRRIKAYFKENSISRYGDYRMILKAILMLGIYIAPFIVILTVDMPAWLALILMVIMGIGEAGIGMGVMHDAAHGSFSKRKWINALMSESICLLGSSLINWKIQHNVLHHTYPNIHEWDTDLDVRALKLSSNSQQKNRIFKYQHLFGPFLYSLLTLNKFLFDIRYLKMYRDKGALAALHQDYKATLIKQILLKLVYLAVFFVLPILFTDFAIWQIILGFVIMHLTASMIMGTVFQLAHVVEDVEEPLPNENGEIHNQYAVHQLETTSDFGKRNGLFSWYIGGLNFQVVHHLFPNVSHVHYAELSSIVRTTAHEFNQPYHWERNAFSALKSHLRTLKRIGRS